MYGFIPFCYTQIANVFYAFVISRSISLTDAPKE